MQASEQDDKQECMEMVADVTRQAWAENVRHLLLAQPLNPIERLVIGVAPRHPQEQHD